MMPLRNIILSSNPAADIVRVYTYAPISLLLLQVRGITITIIIYIWNNVRNAQRAVYYNNITLQYNRLQHIIIFCLRQAKCVVHRRRHPARVVDRLLAR